MKPSRIELDIEELVLIGFDPRDRYAIAEAMQRELMARLASDGLSPAWSGADGARVLDAGSVALPARAAPAETGAAIARGISSGGK